MKRQLANLFSIGIIFSILTNILWAQESKPQTIPPPFTSPADVYSGISGAGSKVAGDGSGNDSQSNWREKSGIVRIEFASDGKIKITENQSKWILFKKQRETSKEE